MKLWYTMIYAYVPKLFFLTIRSYMIIRHSVSAKIIKLIQKCYNFWSICAFKCISQFTCMDMKLLF